MNFYRLDKQAKLPTRSHPTDAGMDLYNLNDVQINPGEGKTVKTGWAVEIPQGNVGLICDRSSLAKRGIKTAGGVIDCGYEGEVGVILWNLSQENILLKEGERIAQLLVMPIEVSEPIEQRETHTH